MLSSARPLGVGYVFRRDPDLPVLSKFCRNPDLPVIQINRFLESLGVACATAPVAAVFSATCGAPARRSAGACSAPRAPMRRPPWHLASYAALTAAGDVPVRPRCAGASRAPDLAFPANAATSAAKVAKGSARLNLRLNLACRPISLVESMSYSPSSNLSRVHREPWRSVRLRCSL